ncbi:hypothetical protein AGMMS50262_09760 [Bacteroidia bacterium]|nr:hypothetical protein AGMMS50262_09760 [Bacteroidia bacterium]
MKKITKKTFLTFLALLLAAMSGGLQAQVQTTSLKVTYVSGNETVTDELVFDGAEIIILNNTVTITSDIAESNKSYAFDNIRTLAFETTEGSGIKAVKLPSLKAYKDGNVLRINASEAIGQFTVYSITGDAVYNGYADNTNTEINIAYLPHGVYVLQAGASHVKFVK